jgi:subtilisin-like proprotein convertase family protein
MTGSATVSTDVWLGFAIGHADISQLRVTLENPSGTRSVVYSGDSTGTDLWFEGRVGGFPGDESSNGVWTLIVEDVVEDGAVGFLSWVELTVGSRFD